ncbi:GtrA-like protein [Clavibacter michiganensis subsp. michiganensis]|uniref:GtrA-like protein n=1 Tax=Clavibacter michiganensis subsp. michiganensis TaxID=33013 RepID=A0A251XGZ5_CLAMM|nr:GtrA-like protein [Clavibacter michiganensis subsp. michiganensis]OUE02310.1 GtrA-like protein [Clavibacter michiganensis subsp. michiganensis]
MTRLLADRRVRFLVAGLLNTALDFVLLNALILAAHMPVLAANLISVTVGITISYFLNHFFVFRHGEAVTIGRFLKFFASPASARCCCRAASSGSSSGASTRRSAARC